MDGSFDPPLGPQCPQCGAALRALHPGQPPECARCWLALATDTEGARVGEYRLLGELGEGGSARVHLAEKGDTGKSFALKIAKDGVRDAELIFRNELQNARRLGGADPGVVNVLDHGRATTGQAFLVLELMEGGSLADVVRGGAYADLPSILGLIGKLASTLARAHAHAVLHCDLKPENILFDAQGEPHIGDFGVAQELGGSGAAQGHAFGGSRGWMSPEQARHRLAREAPDGEAPSLTVASDIFSLGVLLYWLVARRLPFGSSTDFEERVQHEQPARCIPARRWTRPLEWECALIVRRTLAKEPSDRYRSAAELADDIQRALSKLPLAEESARPHRHLATWVGRHQLLAFAVFQLSLLLLYLPLVPFLLLGQSRAVLIDQNSNAALHQAGAVMNELRDVSDRMLRMAENPQIQALLQRSDPFAEVTLSVPFEPGKLENFLVFTPDGVMRARSPAPTHVPPRLDFSFRDYFQGAMGLGRAGLRQMYVSRVIRSQTTGNLELEPSTPMFGEDGKLVGVLARSLLARSTFGTVQMNCAGSGRCMTGLLAARDHDEPGAAESNAITFIAAPELATGREVALDLALSGRICRRFGCTPRARDQFVSRTGESPLVVDFVDPVSRTPSLGAFAPVGGTGLIVVVATPQSAIRGLTDRMLDKARSYLGVPLLIGAALFGALLASLKLGSPVPPSDARKSK